MRCQGPPNNLRFGRVPLARAPLVMHLSLCSCCGLCCADLDDVVFNTTRIAAVMNHRHRSRSAILCRCGAWARVRTQCNYVHNCNTPPLARQIDACQRNAPRSSYLFFCAAQRVSAERINVMTWRTHLPESRAGVRTSRGQTQTLARWMVH